MSEEDDLARRFFGLWAEYLAALVADPKMTESLRRWLAIAAGSLQDASPGDASAGTPPQSSSGPAPPGSAPPGSAPPGSTTDAATAAGASGERDAAVAELARRVDELEERVAALDRPDERPGERNRRPAAGARSRNRPARS